MKAIFCCLTLGVTFLFGACEHDASPAETDSTSEGTDASGTGTSSQDTGSGTGTSDPDTDTQDTNTAPEGTPVAQNGQLHVEGTNLVNEHGKAIQLRGMSTHGLQWYPWGDCLDENTLDALASDWGIDILRVSMYVQEDGYETDPDGFTQMADAIVDALIERGLYALIDWHMLDPGDPNVNTELAKNYFDHMATKYGGMPNVLYEIANEPSDVSWADIKTYAEEMVPYLRSRDSSAVVIVGTPDWSSFGLSGENGPQEVIDDALELENVMYAFHFYAASHGEYYRDGLADAAAALPVFVTEWGTQDYTGDGPNDFVSSQLYLDFFEEQKISWINWNFSDDPRTGAVLKSGTCPLQGWDGQTDLKAAGTWVRDRIRSPADDF